MGIALLTISASVFAAQPNQWHELVLDQSSPDQAIQILGRPARDDAGAFLAVMKKQHRSPAIGMAYLIAKSPTAKALSVRMMLFEGVEGFTSVVLIFRGEKLALIGLAPDKTNKINAADIPDEYGVPFRPIFSQRDLDAMWTMWDQSDQEVRPRQYPDGYELVGSSSDGLSGVVVGVNNMPSFGKELVRGLDESVTHTPSPDEKNPGRVASLSLLSPHALAIPSKPHNPTLR
jgi:hypothetical protein